MGKKAYVKSTLFILFLLAQLVLLTNCTDDKDLLNQLRDDNFNAVKKAIIKGANVNQTDSHGETLLMLAAYKGDIDLVRMLILKGADVNAVSKYGSTPLLAAVQTQDTVNMTCILELLLSAGASPVVKEHKMSALIMISSTGNIEGAELLLKHGANINSKYWLGYTPVVCATVSGHKPMLEFLLEKGADINVEMPDGRNVLDIAIEFKRQEVIEFINKKYPNLEPSGIEPPPSELDEIFLPKIRGVTDKEYD